MANWGDFAPHPPGDTQQHQGTFLVVTAGGEGATGLQWVETRAASNHPNAQDTPHNKGSLPPRPVCQQYLS